MHPLTRHPHWGGFKAFCETNGISTLPENQGMWEPFFVPFMSGVASVYLKHEKKFRSIELDSAIKDSDGTPWTKYLLRNGYKPKT